MKQQSINIAIAILAGFFFSLISLTFLPQQQAILIGLVSTLVVLWTNEALPLGAVALLPIILFPMFEINTTNEVTSQYSKSIIFLFLGGFMLAIAVEKTGLHKVIADKMLRLFPKTVAGIIYALAITSGVLSSFLSNTTTTLLLIPLALFLSEERALKLRFALAIAYGANIGGIITPIGTAPNLIMLGLMEDKSMEVIPFMQWVMMTLPVAFIMLVVVGFILSLGVKQHEITPKDALPPITPDQKKLVYVLIGLVIILFANSPIKPFYDGLGLNEKGILLAVGLLMFAPPISVLTWEDSKKIPYEIIFLFGAGFSIALAFTSTGLADTLANFLLNITHLEPIILLALIAGLVTFTTEITSNTALISMLLPVIYAVTIKAGLDTTLFMMVATICSSYAFMLPIATPPNAIAMSSGVVHINTMMKYGVAFNFLGIFIITLVASTFWKFVLN
jgi:solute carrier family 13 (sodium-dependent dicarboxylate transporter), member 2/3/5